MSPSIGALAPPGQGGHAPCDGGWQASRPCRACEPSTATRYVTPLREGGSLPGDRGGRRRRAVRPQVPRRGAGHQGAGGGDRGRRAGARARPAGARDRADRASIPRSARAEPDPEIQDLITRERRASTSGSTSCPARCRTRRPRRCQPTPELAADGRVARRAGHERRPHAAQPEPARVARAAVADRPRRGALLPPRATADPRGATRRAVRRHRASTCCCRCAARSPRPTRGSRRSTSRVRAIVGDRGARPDGWLDADADARVRRLPDAAARGAARVRRGGGACPRREPVPVRDRARRAARRARRVHQRRRGRSSAGRGASSAARIALDEARLAALAPGRSTGGGARRTSTRSTRIAAGDADAGPGRAARAVRALPLAGRAVEHGDPDSPVHTGLCDDPEETLARLLGEAGAHEGDRPRPAPLDRSAPGLGSRGRAGQPRRLARAGRLHALRRTSSSIRRCRTSCGRRSTRWSPGRWSC